MVYRAFEENVSNKQFVFKYYTRHCARYLQFEFFGCERKPGNRTGRVEILSGAGAGVGAGTGCLSLTASTSTSTSALTVVHQRIVRHRVRETERQTVSQSVGHIAASRDTDEDARDVRDAWNAKDAKDTMPVSVAHVAAASCV